jgi:Fe-S cluster assembly protein SufD
VYFAGEGQWFDLQPTIRHIAPRATSDVLFKGALQGDARTVFRGNVFVAEHAVGTVTDENNKTLILSHGARADATPFLEILCADIQAGHGSATGQIDANALYYLESRGIPRERAIRLIVSGFFREVLEGVDAPGVEERTMELIDREIARADIASIGISDAVLPIVEG